MGEPGDEKGGEAGMMDRNEWIPDHERTALEFSETRGRYRVRFARTPEDRLCVQRLRYEVFALELGASVHGAERELDADPLDALVDHLLVIDEVAGECVGTYRLATREQVGSDPGFYTRRQFDLTRLDPRIEAEGVELGRACIALRHRNRGVLHLLLRGIGAHLTRSRKRFLFGCGSVMLKEPGEAAFVVRAIEREGWIDRALEVAPTEDYRLPCAANPSAIGPELPPLLHAYCAMGARLAARPAWDPDFRSLDFFVLLDREAMDPRSAARYCGARGEQGVRR
jgi:putative hemolysin